MKSMLRSYASSGLLILGVLSFAAPHAAAQMPRSLGDLVLGARFRPQVELELLGDTFHGMPVFSDAPYVLWPVGEAEHLPAMEPTVVAAWIHAAAPALGLAGLRLHFVESWSWREATVWSFALEHDGLELWRARVQAHFTGGRLSGLALDVPQPLLEIEPFSDDLPRDGSYVLLAERGELGYRAVATRAVRSESATHVTTTVGSQRLVQIVNLPPAKHAGKTSFTEWNVPAGSFPDQIELDSQGSVWFSQPPDNWLTRFDPQSETFTQFSVNGGSAPDGMCVDSQDRAWTGFNGGGGLGLLENGVHTAFAAPYAGATMAIPKPTSQGTLWVTDHLANRISEFDPATSGWVQSLVLPISGAWVVEGDEDPATSTFYFTCYSANKLAIKPLGQPIGQTNTPGFGGPAFPVVSNGVAYYSLWSVGALGAYDIAAGTHTLYAHALPAEVGGPIGALPDGRIVLGTRGAGYILVFHPASATFDAYKIPTTVTSNLKDGLTVGPNNEVWFTETSANKIARLKLF
jgi:streptogramin lyase